MPEGKIKFYSIERGFGFIVPDDGSGDVFVHIRKVVSPPGCISLKGDQRVSFDVAQNDRNGKSEAVNVRVV